MQSLFIFGAFILLVLGVFFTAKAMGAGQEREKQLEKSYDQSKAQLEIAARGPAAPDAVVDSMFSGDM